MGRAKLEDLSPELQGNVNTIVPRINDLLEAFGEYRKVTSGYRPEFINAKIPNAAKKSNHTLCLACDLEDRDGRLDKFCLDNPHILEKIGLWQEAPASTPTWTHLQAVPPKSGKRVFNP